MLRIGAWLKRGGWETGHINALDPYDRKSEEEWGRVRRKTNGTGKVFRQNLPWPRERIPVPRRYARYGISIESFSEQISRYRPDLILITSGMTYWYEGLRETVELCRTHHGNIPIAIGGIYASLMPEHCRRVCDPDYVLKGEGDRALKEQLGHLFPFPDEELDDRVDVEDPVWKESAVVRLNRGCPMKCEYCASRLLEPRFVPGEPERAFARIKEFFDRWGTRNFAFYDDALLVNRDRLAKPFLEEILRWGEKVNFYLPNAVHARYLDRELLDMMARAGFKEIRMGYESSSDEFHEKHDQKLDHDTFEKTVRTIGESDFPLERCAAYVLAGLPGQISDDVEKSVRTVSSYGIRCRIAQYSPVPGSALWEESCRFSKLPLSDEPVYHNNTFFSMEWERFARDDLERIKLLTRQLSLPAKNGKVN